MFILQLSWYYCRGDFSNVRPILYLVGCFKLLEFGCFIYCFRIYRVRSLTRFLTSLYLGIVRYERAIGRSYFLSYILRGILYCFVEYRVVSSLYPCLVQLARKCPCIYVSGIYVLYSFLGVLYRDSTSTKYFYVFLTLDGWLYVQRVFLDYTNCRVRTGFYTNGRRKVARVMANVARMCGLASFWVSRVLASYRRVDSRLYQVVFIHGTVPCQGAYVFYGLFCSFLAGSAVFSAVVRSSRGSYYVYGTFFLASLEAYQVRMYTSRSGVVNDCLGETTNSYAYFFGGGYGVFTSMVFIGLTNFLLYFGFYKWVGGVYSLLQYGIFRYRGISSFWIRGGSLPSIVCSLLLFIYLHFQVDSSLFRQAYRAYGSLGVQQGGSLNYLAIYYPNGYFRALRYRGYLVYSYLSSRTSALYVNVLGFRGYLDLSFYLLSRALFLDLYTRSYYLFLDFYVRGYKLLLAFYGGSHEFLLAFYGRSYFAAFALDFRLFLRYVLGDYQEGGILRFRAVSLSSP